MPKRVVDEVGSEDDGPPDFTINLEKWMKGTQLWEKEQGGADMDGNQGSFKGEAEDRNEEESESVPVGSSTPTRVEKSKEVPTVENERAKTPPLTRLDTEALQDKAAEEVFNQISALQAEVERLRLEAEESQAEKCMLEEQHLMLNEEYADLRQDLQDAMSVAARLEEDLKSEKEQLAQEMGKRRDNGIKVGSLRAKFEPIAQELAIAKSDAAAAKQTADAKIEGLEQRLQSSQGQMVTSQDEFESYRKASYAELEDLRSQLEKYEQDIASQQHDSEARERDLELQVAVLEEKVRVADESTTNITILRTELEYAQEQLSETRRVVETVEDENDRFALEIERQAQELEVLRAEVGQFRVSMQEKECTLQEVEGANKKLKEELERMQTVKHSEDRQEDNGAEQPDMANKEHQSDMEAVISKHESEVNSLKETLLRAAEGMKKREGRLASTHHEQVSSLKEQIASLEKQNADITAAAKNRRPTEMQTKLETAEASSTTKLRRAIRILSSKLKTTQADLVHTQQEATRSREDAEEMQRTNEAVNIELERKFAEVFEKREKEWRRRVALLLRDREKMGKALMWGWGKEEVGPMKGQGEKEGEERMGYRYRFAKR